MFQENDLPNHSTSEIRKLPPEKRIPYVEQIRIKYPRWKDTFEELELFYKRAKTSRKPRILPFVGYTGTGKTTLLDAIVETSPARVTENTVVRQIVKATLFPPMIHKTCATSVLRGLHDPSPATGTSAGMTIRVEGLLNDCQTILLIVDETQEIYDKEKSKLMENASNWLKYIIKEHKLSCIMAGLKGQVEEVIKENEQLRRLSMTPIELEPFQWDENRKEVTVKEFSTLLSTIEDLLPLNLPSRLCDNDLAYRCFVSCRGQICYLMSLITEATYIALEKENECIEKEYLAEAFDRELSGEFDDISNPFTSDELPGYPPPKPKPVPLFKDGTNNRSKKRT